MTTQLSSQVRVVPEARFELTHPESKSGALPTRLFGSIFQNKIEIEIKMKLSKNENEIGGPVRTRTS